MPFKLEYALTCIALISHPLLVTIALANTTGSSFQNSSCQALSLGNHHNILKEKDKELLIFFKKMESSITTQDNKLLSSLFHHRLKVNATQIKSLFLKHKISLGGPVKVSLYRIFELKPTDSKASTMACDPNIHLTSHYGYDQQYFVFWSLMGKTDLGRQLMTIVNSPGGWKVGFSHFAKFSHKSLSYQEWIKNADQSLSQQNYINAYLSYDIAKKLLSGSFHHSYPYFETIKNFQDANFNLPALKNHVKMPDDNFKLLSITSSFAKDGLGLKVMLRLKKELSYNQLKEGCQKIGTSLKAQQIDGVSCHFYLPFESTDSNGVLGSRYISLK